MRLSPTVVLLALALPRPSLALIGYGITMYKPLCSFACRSSIASAMLSCSNHDNQDSGHMHGGGPTTPECRAGDTPFLTTLAWCMNSTCTEYHEQAWALEKYWADKATGDASVAPKWTYTDTLIKIDKPPTRELGKDEMLNFTALVSHETWLGYIATHEHFEHAETLHSRYGIVLLVTGFGTPIVFTLLGRLPYMTGVFEKLMPYIVYPSIFGTYHVRPLPYLLGNAPTVGQSLYVAMFLVLNIVLTSVGYSASQPNMWFASNYQEIMGYLSSRTGVLAFALAPLVVLFAGRNNVLLWATNWSHSTYLLLHRWVARLFALQVILHSITELVLYIDMGEFQTETKAPYWIWGIVATLTTCIMLVISPLYVRRWSYEIFLLSHIVMAIFTIVGCWYHVEIQFTRKWGYQLWLYATCAVWFFDRLMRVFRILKTGVCYASITTVTEDIVRIDVKGVRWLAQPGMHTYAYFPSLNPLRPWENHPFSIIPTALVRPRGHSGPSCDDASPSPSPDAATAATLSSETNRDVEKSGIIDATNTKNHGVILTGISLYVRKSAGMTRYLHPAQELRTLLDGPYHNNTTAAVLKCDRLLLVAGGIGITGVLAFITCHTNIKLCWSMRQSAENLAHDLNPALNGLAEKDVRVGTRLDVATLLAEEEKSGWAKIGVVVCGPGGLCDDVRAMVVAKGRGGSTVWELEVDAFSW